MALGNESAYPKKSMNCITRAKPRLGILISHPIQYFSPWFRALAGRSDIEVKVFYCLQPTKEQQGAGFGVPFEWDVPLLEGYEHEFLPNVARRPGLNFSGCDTPSVRSLIASRRFDVWLVPGWKWKSYWQAMRACWRHRVPMMVRGEANLLDARPLHVRLVKRLILGRWIPRFSAYLTIGRLNEECYRFYGADAARFFPVRYAVDNDFFAREVEALRGRRLELRREWRIPENAFCVVFSGKFVPRKRPTDLVEAARLLVRDRRVPDLHLLFVGSGELGAQLRAGCNVVFDAENPVSARLAPRSMLPSASFAGFLNQTEIARAYAACDVLVLPSGYRETWGLVVNEAMACGKPAIVSNKVGCGPDLVVEGETGRVFPVGDIACLADAMLAYITDRSSALRQGQKAQELLHRSFSVQCATENTVTAVHAALSCLPDMPETIQLHEDRHT